MNRRGRKGRDDLGTGGEKAGKRAHAFNVQRAEHARLLQGLLTLEELFKHHSLSDVAGSTHTTTNTLRDDIDQVARLGRSLA